MEMLATAVPGIGFRHLMALYPLATAVHVLEEWPRFPAWARRLASPRYGDREYLLTHAATLALALGTALAVTAWPSPWLVVPFFALVFAPGVFWNAWFHAAATLASGMYCAGVVSGLLL